ncbi:fimbria/pilus outer membrane usher protein [Kalamiella sp. sgz302252]|uniref:fimbria/pilus outer membrane usher protein n=1 Tax=Pantoea sp. sgz302252 TaxID=3341827 RepID=UPI0036D33AED
MHHPEPFLSEKRMQFSPGLALSRTFIASAIYMTLAAQAAADETSTIMEFNPAFVHGATIDVSRFATGNVVDPGSYTVTVLVNNVSHGKATLPFYAFDGQSGAQPCFTLDALQRLGVKTEEIKESFAQAVIAKGNCARLEKAIPGSSSNYDSGDILLSLIIPQAYMHYFPRGYTDPASWEAGVPAVFIDYRNNFYNLYSGPESRSHHYSNNLNLTAGVNAGGWRLRKQLNNVWSNQDGMKTTSQYGYGQTDIIALKSQLTLGDSATRGLLFDSFTLRGIQLQSDERMLPDGIRHYVPLLRGIAESNARVRVMQRDQIVYETTVPPGPFELADVGAMGYGGDLLMTITEANGSERSQTIPFSAPPMLLHKGVSQFSFAGGQLRDSSLRHHPELFEGVYQYGLANMYTIYGGTQLTEHYRAFAAGNAFNTPIGGISLDGTHAKTELANGKTTSGNSFRIGYSKYLESTNTDIMLAAWRYSTKGYYNLREASIAHDDRSASYYEPSYRARQRLTLTLGQPLWHGAYLNASGSLYRYWDGRPPVTQYSLSYSQSARYFSWSLAASRSKRAEATDLNSITLSVNVPLGAGGVTSKPLFNSLYSSYTHDNAGNALFQTNATGYQGDRNELTYGVGASLGQHRDSIDSQSVTGNLSYRSPYGQLGITGSGTRFASRQLSLSANGSLIAHQGGITAGPQLGDNAFAIVNVPGGKGAKLQNGYGSVVDGRGYAIMPSLTAYRKNSVAVDAKGLPDTVDVMENEAVVIPRAGAALSVKMKTLTGAPAILTVRESDGGYLPVGTELVDAQGVSQTIVGQRGQAFIRGWEHAGGTLSVAGEEAKKCRAGAEQNRNGMLYLEVICSR